MPKDGFLAENTMDEVLTWLNALGLGRLGDAFVQAQIDFDALRLLSDDDLKELGIPLGPRRKILSAIAQLDEAREPHQRPMVPVERRPLTILFCDMVGSTEYAARLDPEDFSKLTQTYLNRCAALVKAHGGFTANYIGDALQALFGYPTAEEDDAERAIRLGFSLIQAMPQIETPDGSRLEIRIGIASGLVVVGDFAGAPAGVSTVAFGPVPNLAQRLQALAAPQTILADQKTRDAANGAFDFVELGAKSLKGFGDPVRIWRIDKARTLENRFAKRTHLTKLVGRRAELDRLRELAEGIAAEKSGRAILVSGEAGIGKSRLIFEARSRAAHFKALTLQCAPAYSNSALYPFLDLLKRHAGINDAAPAKANAELLEATLSSCDILLSQTLPVFSRLLAIEHTDYSLPDMTSKEQQTIVRRFFVEWLQGMSQTDPLWLTIEDEQWIDPSSGDVLKALIDEVRFSPMLIVVTSREAMLQAPAKNPSLLGLRLRRLTRFEAQALCRVLAAGSAMTDDASDFVLARAEGVPLYVEELCRAVADGHAASILKEGPDAAADIPVTLQSFLLSRLDKLGTGKMIAQMAAVIGRVFNIGLLAHLSGLSEEALVSILDRLIQAGLIAPQPAINWPSYSFTHALLQEAAQATLLRDRRRQLHHLVAEGIEKLYPRQAAEHPEVLAQHLAAAGLYQRAADCWLTAGLKTGATWAKVEAANMFANGLECLQKLPPSPERDRKCLKLELERGDVLYATFGHVTPEGSAAYRNVMSLSESLGDPEAAIRALDGLFGTALNSARFADAEWASDQLLDMGRQKQNLKALVLGMQFKGMCLFSQGRLEEARRYLEEALAYRSKADEVGSDFPNMTMIYLSWALHLLGHHERAIMLYREAEEDARHQSAYRLAAWLGNGCVLMALRKDVAALQAMVDELGPLAKANGFQLWANLASFFQGWAMVHAHHDGRGLQQMRATCDNLGEQQIDKPCYLGLLAEANLALGEFEGAAGVVDEALALTRKTGEHYFTAELLRLGGVAGLYLKGDAHAAERAFRKSAAFAQKQGAKTWELKATQSLAELYRSTGRKTRVKRRLDAITGWFEGQNKTARM
nr:adenylate/guanylate cyclase domain-containing protein [Rhizobium etli]